VPQAFHSEDNWVTNLFHNVFYDATESPARVKMFDFNFGAISQFRKPESPMDAFRDGSLSYWLTEFDSAKTRSKSTGDEYWQRIVAGVTFWNLVMQPLHVAQLLLGAEANIAGRVNGQLREFVEQLPHTHEQEQEKKLLLKYVAELDLLPKTVFAKAQLASNEDLYGARVAFMAEFSQREATGLIQEEFKKSEEPEEPPAQLEPLKLKLPFKLRLPKMEEDMQMGQQTKGVDSQQPVTEGIQKPDWMLLLRHDPKSTEKPIGGMSALQLRRQKQKLSLATGQPKMDDHSTMVTKKHTLELSLEPLDAGSEKMEEGSMNMGPSVSFREPTPKNFDKTLVKSWTVLSAHPTMPSTASPGNTLNSLSESQSKEDKEESIGSQDYTDKSATRKKPERKKLGLDLSKLKLHLK
jgi:hypothetical protein